MASALTIQPLHLFIQYVTVHTIRSCRPEYYIVREVYEQGGEDAFENELDRALEVETQTIVIEPIKLGLETARWITIGNGLHKISVLSGLGCLVASAVVKERAVVLSLGFTSFICAGVYAASWQFDPCCKYQVENDIRRLDRLPLHKLSTSSPIVLVRKDDNRRKILHNTIAMAAVSLCCWKLYKWYS